MLNVFETDDGVFHRAVLSLNRLVLVRLIVERLALKNDCLAEWEWMVWPVHDVWEVDAIPLSGREPSLGAAKRNAFDTGIAMLAGLTRDRSIALRALVSFRPAALMAGVALHRAS